MTTQALDKSYVSVLANNSIEAHDHDTSGRLGYNDEEKFAKVP